MFITVYMGYKYGVWLTYDERHFNTEHIGHVTISCFLTRDDAFRLHREIVQICGNHADVIIKGKHEYFPSSYYIHDNNKMCSWGYAGTSQLWDKYKTICNDFECDFSPTPHTSIQYAIHPNVFSISDIKDKNITCSIHVADIRSDFPTDWKILL